MISKAIKNEMLKTVRAYLRYRLFDEARPELTDDPFYENAFGIFVTLHLHGRLRGCIGYIEGVEPLSKALFDMTNSAAFHDPRFEPLSAPELDRTVIEISILSPLEPVDSYHDIEIGKHGILIRNGIRQAVFLPQVAPEQGWDLLATLRHLCMKAGLPVDAYLDEQTDFFVFTAEVFSEEER